MAPEVGTEAPDFTVKDQNNQDVTLSSFRGDRAVLLVFYPFAFSGTCTGELCAVRDNLADFQNDDVQILGISTDPPYALKAWSDSQGFDFPLLSDFWPHGEVTRAYGVFDSTRGAPRRSSYILDKAGTVRWSVHNANPDGRDLDEHLKELRTLA